MSKVNRGKDFEHQVLISLNSIRDVNTFRLYDVTSGFSGVAQIADYVCYKYPHQYAFECKSCYGNTLPFSNITDTQWNGLIEAAHIKGLIAGYIVWFIDHDLTVFVPARVMGYLKKKGYKSLNVKMLDDIPHIKIDGKKRRVLFDYDFIPFFEEMERRHSDK